MLVKAIFLSIASGIASALLSGVLTPGSMLSAFLFFIAPLPLMIVGLGWHALIAALGALVGCLLMDVLISSKAALYFGLLVGLPAYLASVLVPRLPALAETGEAVSTGRRLGGLLFGALGGYAVVVTLIGAMTIDTSYDALQTKLATTVEMLFRAMTEGAPGRTTPPGFDVAAMSKLYAFIMPGMLTFLVTVMLVLSLWLAMRIVARSGRLPVPPFPGYLIALPRQALAVILVALIVSRLDGYLGLAASLVLTAATVAAMLAGLSLLHFRTLGRRDRGFLLWAGWIAVLVFGLPAFLFAIAGALDAAFDFRRPPGGPAQPT